MPSWHKENLSDTARVLDNLSGPRQSSWAAKQYRHTDTVVQATSKHRRLGYIPRPMAWVEVLPLSGQHAARHIPIHFIMLTADC